MNKEINTLPNPLKLIEEIRETKLRQQEQIGIHLDERKNLLRADKGFKNAVSLRLNKFWLKRYNSMFCKMILLEHDLLTLYPYLEEEL
jgi:hypothetical protein